MLFNKRGVFALVCAAGLAASVSAQDVTHPGDAATPSSTNHPAGEPSTAVIDNLASTKYLNFDETNTGFTVTPTGTGIVRGMVLITANDAPERDPSSYTLEGSDDGVNWVMIAQGALNPPTARYSTDQVSFANNTAYLQYRVMFPTVRNSNAANSMQVAEVQLVTHTDILTPGDPFVVTYPAGGSSPTNEGPANLFDNRLNAKMGVNGGNAGATIIDVTPGVGASVISGFEIWGAGDDATWGGRTPSYATIYGSNDGVNYTQIFTSPLTQATANYQGQDFSFANSTGYTRYRIELGACADVFMQVGEIQLYGSVSNAPPANDSCSTPMTIHVGDNAGSNFNATGTDTTACGSNDTADVWFRYVATSTGPLEFNTFGAGVLDTTLAVYPSCAGASLGCDDNSRGGKSRVTINATTGQTYLVRVAGVGGTTGSFTLTVDDSPAANNDVLVPLSFNFNGMVHAGEEGQPDNPDGFRAISDRAMRITGGVGSLEVGLEGPTGIKYWVQNQANVFDMIHLGNRNMTDNGNWAFALTPDDGDNIGIQPNWISDPNQFGPHVSDVSALGLGMDAATQVGVLYNASNGGNYFDCTLTFTDGSSATLTLNAPDWYGLQDVAEPLPGVATQTSMGTYFGAEDVDAGLTGVDLNIVEAVISNESLIAGGFGDFAGRQIASISFGNQTAIISAVGVYAVTVRNPAATCRADFNGDNFLDFFDYSDYVACFEDGTCPPGKTADFNGDDFVDFFDYSDYVAAFETGC